MQDRSFGEQVAKAGIYLVFSLSLFAFLLFVHGARQFGTAGAVEEAESAASSSAGEMSSASLPGSAPAESLLPGGAPAAAEEQSAPPAPAVQSETASRETAAVADEEPAETESRALPQEGQVLKREAKVEALPEAEVGLEPNVYGKEVDMAALQSELSRMAAMGFSFSGGLSANYIGEFYATSYCAEAYPHICGGNGVTASGTAPTPGLTVASDWSVLPPGTWIYISGVGIRRVEDSGGAIKGARLDVVLATHAEALAWRGQGNHDVWILS